LRPESDDTTDPKHQRPVASLSFFLLLRGPGIEQGSQKGSSFAAEHDHGKAQSHGPCMRISIRLCIPFGNVSNLGSYWGQHASYQDPHFLSLISAAIKVIVF
jgi:hypothetical protein